MIRFCQLRPRAAASCCLPIVLLLFLVLGQSGQGFFSAAGAETAAAGEDVSTVLASIERAWSEADADAIVERFGMRKVLLRLPGNQHSSRRFSHQQSLLILRDHFRSCEIRRFSFVRTQVPEAQHGKAMGLAEVTWRRYGVGRTKEGRVLMVLQAEGNRWVLTEVLALP